MSETAGSKGLVVFIDDEDSQTGPMNFYEDALAAEGYEVERIRELPTALDYIRITDDKPVLWMVDVMMPVLIDTLEVDGERLINAASRGLASGRVLYRQIRKRFTQAPVILLTNVTTPQILESLEAEMDERAVCEAKIAVLPSDLVVLVNSMTEQPQNYDQR